MNFLLKILLVFIFAMPASGMEFSLQHPEDIKEQYTWIYHQVELYQDLIAKIITESGLTLGDKTHVSIKN